MRGRCRTDGVGLWRLVLIGKRNLLCGLDGHKAEVSIRRTPKNNALPFPVILCRGDHQYCRPRPFLDFRTSYAKWFIVCLTTRKLSSFIDNS